MIELYDKCPSFDTCSAPKCPLDSKYNKVSNRLKGEERCKSRKSVRLKIVKEYPDFDSPFKGYTGMEWAGKSSFTQSTGEQTISRGL